MKEAAARVKINKLLENAGWRFFADAKGPVRHIMESGHRTDHATNALFSTSDFKAVPPKYRAIIPEYSKDYVSLNQFAA